MASDPPEATHLLAEAHLLSTEGHDVEAALKTKEAFAAAERSGDTACQALAALAIAEQSNAIEDIEKAVDLYRQCGDKYGEANALLALGNFQCQAGRLEFALLAGKRAMQLLKASDPDDASQILTVLGFLVSTHVAKQDSQEAKRLMYQTAEQFRAAGNLAGYSQTIEMALGLYWNEQDWDGAVFTAEKALKVFQAENHRAGEASMWLAMSKAWIRQEPADGLGQAVEAAQKATTMFAEVDMYQAEEEAQQVYNFLDEKLTAAKMKELEVLEFYKVVRVDGIQYGPAYRINDTMMFNLAGPAFNVAALQMKHETEEWEDEITYHPAMIDAAGHAGLGHRQARPPPKLTKEQIESIKKSGQDSGAQIPFMMDHGHFSQRKAKGKEPMYLLQQSSATSDTYMLQN